MKKQIIDSSAKPTSSKGSKTIDTLAEKMRENLKKRKAQAREQGRAPIKQIKEI